LNEKQLLPEASLQVQKILNALNRKRFVFYLILAFFAGCLVTTPSAAPVWV
jgi:hypothetical protein